MSPPPPRPRGSLFRLVALAASLLVPAGAGAAPPGYQVKAAHLYNLGKFVEWPASAFAQPQAPFILCLLGVDPFGGDLDELVRQGDVQGRRVQIRRLQDPAELRACNILFVAASEQKRQRAVLSALGGAPTLTVGETDDFIAAGGALRLFLFEDKVRFEINRAATARAHLKVSSRLLSLARVVAGP